MTYVLLAVHDKVDLQLLDETWYNSLAQYELRLKLTKTEYLTTDASEHRTINISGVDLPRTEHFE